MAGETRWMIYLLYHPVARRTYVGSTTDPLRRLRQHNGELVGGARATRAAGPGWVLAAVVTGFTSRKDACRWEKLVKVRTRGLPERRKAMQKLCIGRECPPARRTGRNWTRLVYRAKHAGTLNYPVPHGLIYGQGQGIIQAQSRRK